MPTRIRPIRPARSPRWSCSSPSVAEICSSLRTSKVSGREPKFSWRASVAADAWSNEPEMIAWPFGITLLTCGAEITRPSSTMANWSRGGSRSSSRVVASAKMPVPASSNSRLTTHSLVNEPCAVTFSPELAPAIMSPSISTGPSAYLAVPPTWQVTNALSGSPTWFAPPVRFSGSVQSSSLNCATTSSVSQARSLGSAGSVPSVGADSVGSGVGSSVAALVTGSGVGVASSVGASVGSGSSTTAPSSVGAPPVSSAVIGSGPATASTGRNTICADSRTSSSVSSLGLPGSATTMLLPPWLEISASATPEASTRWRMMSIAWSMAWFVTCSPPVVTGSRMISVPPWRSRASSGVRLPSDQRSPE